MSMERSEAERGRLRRLLFAVSMNASLFILNLAAGRALSNPAFDAEAAHDATDALTHGNRYAGERFSIDAHSRRARAFEFAAKAAICSLAGWALYRSGIEFFVQHEALQDPGPAVAIMGVSAAGNIAVWRVLESEPNPTPYTQRAAHHARTDALATTGLFGALTTEAVTHLPFGSLGGMAMSAYTIYEMNPFRHHDHEH